MSIRARNNCIAALLTLMALVFVLPLAAQTVSTPVVVRTDSSGSGAAKIAWPTFAYDSSRAVVTICGQVRVKGMTYKSVCKTTTGPWVRHVVAPPPPPPPAPVPPPAPPPPAPPPPPPPMAALMLTIVGDTAGTWAIQAVPVGTLSLTQVTFTVDGVLRQTENVEPWCLFGDDGTSCTRGNLGAGAHTVLVKAMNASGGVVLQASRTVTELPAPPPMPVAGLTLTAFLVNAIVDTAVTAGTWTEPTEAVDSVTADFVDFWAGGPPVNAIRRLRAAPSALSVVFRQPIPSGFESYRQIVNVCRWRAGVAACVDRTPIVIPVP